METVSRSPTELHTPISSFIGLWFHASSAKLLNKNLLRAHDISVSFLPPCHNHLIHRLIETAKKAVRSETLPASCNLIHMAFFLPHLLCCQSPGDI